MPHVVYVLILTFAGGGAQTVTRVGEFTGLITCTAAGQAWIRDTAGLPGWRVYSCLRVTPD